MEQRIGHWLRGQHRLLGTASVLAALVSMLAPVSAEAFAASRPVDPHKIWSPPNTALPHTPSVNGRNATLPARGKLHYPAPARWAGPGAQAHPVPRSGHATVDLPIGGVSARDMASAPAAIQAGSLPVYLEPLTGGHRVTPQSRSAAQAASDPVTVTMADPAKAGVHGLLFSLSPAAGSATEPLRVQVDTGTLDAAFGGDAGLRATLVELPACALTTPQGKGCLKATSVKAHTDSASHRLTADVTLPATATSASAPAAGTSSQARVAPMVLAVQTTSSGGGGSYSATSLTPSSQWAAGSSSGGFSYGYPITMPPALAGAAPNVNLSYDSSSVDGRTSATNAQTSWVGEGWDYSPGFIERSYKSCSNDGIANSGDECWGGFNASMSLNGHSGTLVRDDTTGQWHLQGDDGSKIEFLTGAGNGAWNGEYVKVTDTSGTVYYFGLNHLPGGDKTDPATNSAWTVPVYNPNPANTTATPPIPADPCYSSTTGKASWCQMAWRWNLDYVVDPHGNLTTYTYTPETNYYSRGGGQNSGTGTLTAYIRGGSVHTISYGQTLAGQITAKGAAKAAAQVVFNLYGAGRCSTAGGFVCYNTTTKTYTTISSSNAAHWPDVPYDQNCNSSGTCTNYGPSFWTNQELASITTQVLSSGSYKPVDSYALSQNFDNNPNDGTKPPMWLASIQRTGLDGGTITLPAVSFTPAMMPNRVDGSSLVPAPPIYNRPRIQMITTETGEQINVDYNLPQCSRVNNVMPASADSDQMACYNVKWYPPGSIYGASPNDDWFNRYTVKDVTENDKVAGSTAKVTSYTYGKAAWHYDDSEFTDPKTRTWDQFRGFDTVTTVTGSGNDGPQSQTVTHYLQGMNGDHLANGSTRSATFPDSLGETVNDDDWLAGQTLETDTYDKAGGKIVAYTVTRSTHPVTTATRILGNSLPNLVARYDATTTTATSKSLKADGTWQTATATTQFDSAHAGRVTSQDSTGDNVAENCVLTKYATSSNTQVQDLVDDKLTLTGSSACTLTPSKANTVGEIQTLYDNQPYGQAGATGDPTSAIVLDHFDSSGTAKYVTSTVTAYDSSGRVTSTTDPNSTDSANPGGAKSTTTYTAHNAGELPYQVSTTTSAPGSTTGWTMNTTVDLGRGLPLTSTDPNTNTVTETYDALGRLTAVWQPGQSTSDNPNRTFSYAVNGLNGPSTTTAQVLGAGDAYRSTAISIYDGLGRVRQIQTTPGISAYTGRIIADTFYDSHGWTSETRNPYYNAASAPSTTLYTTTDDQVPAQTSTTFDGQGRPLAQVFSSYSQVQSTTTTQYPGADETDVTPPAGGTPTTTITDVRGERTALWQYHTATATAHASDADITTYTYTPAGKLATQTDATGKNTWTHTYDPRGRETQTNDPDTGASTTQYDADSHAISATNANGTILTTYDLLGRPTGTYQSSVSSANQLTGDTYDTVSGAKGYLATSTRYVGGSATGSAYTTAVKSYDSHYRATKTTVSIPGSDIGQSGTYTYTTQAAYDPITGALTASYASAAGDQPAETINYSYDVNGPLLTYGSATATYDLSNDYDAFGRPIRTTLNPWGTEAVATTNYEPATGHILSTWVDSQTSTKGSVDQANYTYNQAGQVTSVQDIPDNTPSQTDMQCYTYDYLGRLTTAWTDSGGVTTKPSPSIAGIGGCTNPNPTSDAVSPALTTVAGPAPYWTSYGYDVAANGASVGNRTSLTQHDITGNTANDVTTTQQFAPAGQLNTPSTNGGTGGPHALLSASTSSPSGTTTTNYQYDAAGNTTSIANSTAGITNLTWNSEGKLDTVSAPSGKTSYIYAPGGALLERKGPTSTTVFLGIDELTWANNNLTDVRTYTAPNGVSIVLTSGSESFQFADLHGTNGLSLDAKTLKEFRRYSDPFGNPRGAAPTSWAGDKGFVNGIQDPATGLTNIGAREYLPATGRFISPDPLMGADPQQWNGYAYANNAPTYLSDASGLMTLCEDTCAPSEGEKVVDGHIYQMNPSDPTLYCLSECRAARAADAAAARAAQERRDKLAGLYAELQKQLQALRNGSGCMGMVLGKTGMCRPQDGSTGGLEWIILGAAGGVVVCMVPGVDVVCAGAGEAASTGVMTGTVEAVGAGGVGALGGGLTAEKVEALAGDAGGTAIPVNGLSVADVQGALQDTKVQNILGKIGKLLASCSFAPGTPVLLADGTTKPIGKIKVGDKVEAADPATGKDTGGRTVQHVWINHDTDLLDVTVSTGHGPLAVIHTTANHPFWDDTTHTWSRADHLTRGHSLAGTHGLHATVVSLRATPGAADRWNLTVEQLHTYYVVAGGVPVLVHNSNCDDPEELAAQIDPQTLGMTKTVENHTWDIAGTQDVDAVNFGKAARPYMTANNMQLIQAIMAGSAPTMDSRGALGVVEWRTRGSMNGSIGTWELNINVNTNTIVHFLFKSDNH